MSGSIGPAPLHPSRTIRPWPKDFITKLHPSVAAFVNKFPLPVIELNIDSAWQTLLVVEKGNLLSDIPPSCLIDYANVLFTVLMDPKIPPNSAQVLSAASRLAHVSSLPEAHQLSLSLDHLYCFRAAAHLGLGEVEDACKAICSIQGRVEQRADIIVITCLVKLITVLALSPDPVTKVFNVLLRLWDVVHPHLYNIRRGLMDHGTRMNGDRLRLAVFGILDSLHKPVIWIIQHISKSNAVDFRRVVQLLLIHLISTDRSQDAFELFKTTTSSFDLPASNVHRRIRFSLARALSSDNLFNAAEYVLDSCTPQSPEDSHYAFANLHFAACQGDVAKAKELFESLAPFNRQSPNFQVLLLHAYERSKDIQGLLKQWSHFHPSTAAKYPPVLHFQTVIRGLAKKGDQAGVWEWLDRYYKCGYDLNLDICTAVMTLFVLRKDVKSTNSLLMEMKRLKIRPDNVFYTLVISLLAERGEPSTAEGVIKLVMGKGLQPDTKMLSSLMDAHVQAGSWRGVIRVFDFIEARRRETNGTYSISVFNTLLKALVRIGAPLYVVMDFSRKLGAIGLKHSVRTWVLLVQSCCDAGRMDIAKDILEEMDDLEMDSDDRHHAYAVILTTMMSGFLRIGNNTRAKEVYEEMLAREIQPLGSTFGKIIRAYAMDGSEESLKVAEDFLVEVKESQLKTIDWTLPSGNTTTFEAVYAPLISAYGQHLRIDDVERLYNSMIEQGGEATDTILTLLLDSYRRIRDHESAKHIWTQLFNRISSHSDSGKILASLGSVKDSRSPAREIRGNKLCVALSIFIESLSWAGLHSEIAAVWSDVRNAGFAFDASNWNHLSCALVRAGELERAFEVVERVLIPFDDWLKDEKNRRRERDPGDVFVFDQDVDRFRAEEFSSFSYELDLDRRTSAQKVVEARMQGESLLQHENEEMKSSQAVGNGDLVSGDDFAWPLFVLQHLIPTWDIWRPHNATLAHLCWAIAQLSGGRIITPLQPEENEGSYPRFDESDILLQENEAHKRLDDIHRRFPRTITLIRQWSSTNEAARQISEIAKRLGGIISDEWYDNESMRQSLQ